MEKRKHAPKANREVYARERAAGATQRQAYKAASPGSYATELSIDQQASRLEKDINVQSSIEYYRRQATAGNIYDVAQIKAILSEIIADPETSAAVRQASIDKLLKASGAYTGRQEIALTGSLSIEDKRQAARAWIDRITGEASTEPQER